MENKLNQNFKTNWFSNAGRTGLIIVSLVSGCITFIMFQNQICNPGRFLFSNVYDGIKNYYALKAYFIQPESMAYSYFSYLNYPFGDSIFYPDISPVLAIPLRWLHLTFQVNSDLLIGYYNYFFIVQFALAAPIVYQILKRFNFRTYTSVWLALIISFTQPQLLKLAGHFDLSSFFSIALSLYLLLKLKDYLNQNRVMKAILVFWSLILLVIFYSCVHVYYLLILLIFIGGFLLSLNLYFLFRKNIKGGFIIHSLLVIVVPVLTIQFLLQVTNPIPEYERFIETGYNWNVWTMQWFDLYRPYSYLNTIKIFNAQNEYLLERFGFVGNMNLLAFSIAILLLLVLLGFYFRKKFQANLLKFSCEIIFLIVAGLSSLFISLGNTFNNASGIVLHQNYFTPLRYLDQRFEIIQQFRCLGRLSYPFFICFSIILFYVVKYFGEAAFKNKNITQVILIFILSIGTVDTVDYIIFVRGNFNVHNIINEQAINQQPAFSKEQFQCILPVPFFHSGSKDLGLTIDDDDNWSKQIYLLSLKNNLPLMACKTARTPDSTAAMQFKTFLQFKLDSTVQSNMNDQKILVVYNPAVHEQSHFEPANTVINNAELFISSVPLVFLKEENGLKYYSWDFRANKLSQ